MNTSKTSSSVHHHDQVGAINRRSCSIDREFLSNLR
ncbi:unnamed protein product, partial [Rotaria sp. Silwood1]